jgi:NitT/TauT family transport system substrate-binding protein
MKGSSCGACQKKIIRLVLDPRPNQRCARPGVWAIALILCMLALAGCPKQQELLRVATNVWPGYETLYLARSLGYYDDKRIRLVEMPSASQVSQSLRNGTIEAGCLTLDETLSLLQDGVDLRVVLIMDISHGADVVMAPRKLAGLKALRGKRVGVENAAVGALMLDAALEAGGLQAKDIRIISLTADEHAAAYLTGRVDAIVTFEPVRSLLMKVGAQVLFDSSRIPGRIINVLVVRAEVAADYAQALRELVQGHFRAIECLKSRPQEAGKLMAPRLNDNALAQFSGLRLPDVNENRLFLAGTSPNLRSAARDLADLMLRRKLLQRPVATDRIADPNYRPGGGQ